MALEVLGGDCRIRMDRKEPRVIPESRDGGGFRRGLICGEEEVEKRGKNTDLGDTRSHHMAGGARRIIPDLENAYLSPCGHTGSSCGAVRSPPTPKSSNAYSTKPSAPSPTPPGMSITANYTPTWASPSLLTRSTNLPFATISGWPVTTTSSLLPCPCALQSPGDGSVSGRLNCNPRIASSSCLPPLAGTSGCRRWTTPPSRRIPPLICLLLPWE